MKDGLSIIKKWRIIYSAALFGDIEAHTALDQSGRFPGTAVAGVHGGKLLLHDPEHILIGERRVPDLCQQVPQKLSSSGSTALR